MSTTTPTLSVFVPGPGMVTYADVSDQWAAWTKGTTTLDNLAAIAKRMDAISAQGWVCLDSTGTVYLVEVTPKGRHTIVGIGRIG